MRRSLRVVIVGAGHRGRELYDWLSSAHQLTARGDIFVDVTHHEEGDEHYPPITDWDNYAPTGWDMVYVAVENSILRMEIVGKLRERGVQRFPFFVHPSALVARTAVIEEGALVFPYAVIGSMASVGAFAFVGVQEVLPYGQTADAYSESGPPTITVHTALSAEQLAELAKGAQGEIRYVANRPPPIDWDAVSKGENGLD